MNESSSPSSGLAGLTRTVGRRTFLRVLGGAGSAAAVTTCAPAPPERIIPYVVPPDDVVPGVATWYASVCGECPSACGTLVKTREGRAIKIEGNPTHPANRGSLCVRGQAALQGLYSPDRYRGPRRRRITHTATGRSVLDPMDWERAQRTLADRLADLRAAGRGDRIAVVTPVLTGTLDALVDRWAAAMGGARRLRYEAFAYEPLRAANRTVFGRGGVPRHDFGRADLVVSFGADFLETWLSTVGHARDLAEARRPDNGRSTRFVHLEPRLSLTASSADEWIGLEPGAEGAVAAAMVRVIVAEMRVQADALAETELDRILALVDTWTPEAAAARSGVPAARIVELARAFSDPDRGPGRSLAVGGGAAVAGAGATETQVAIALLNRVAGNVGATVRFPAATMWDAAATYQDLLDLADAMRGGEIDVLLLHQVNPMHTLPGAADFGAALDAVPLVVATSPHPDETTARADLILPSHTPLEAWGDHRPADGPGGLMQPAMRPLYDTRHFGDILLDTGRAALVTAPADAPAPGGASDLPDGDFYELLRDAWRGLQPEPAGAEADSVAATAAPPPADEAAQADPAARRRAAAAARRAGAEARQAAEAAFETFWADAVRRGGRWLDEPPEPATLSHRIGEVDLGGLAPPGDARRSLTLIAYPSLHLYDGRGANRPWLQEIPDPLLKTAWGSGAEMTPETAAAIGADDGQVVTLESDHGRTDATVVLNPHLPPGVVALPIGQGHTDFGRYATGRGANPVALLDPQPEAASGGPRWAGTRIDATPRALRRPLARLQGSFDQQGRELAQAVSQAALAAGEVHPEEPHFSLYPEHEHPEHRWGMAIDLNACNGCNACVAACYAENNVPVLGADRMVRGRTMSWLRVERFVEERPDANGSGTVDTRFLPMLCQHCDHAPCESVCPVYATYHTEEGLNAQIYNRCVGTRYCSNNCPYKVRRFNWWDPEVPEPLNLQLNPDVTARSAGVMEKCTFCVQRIQEGKERARDDDRPVQDGDVVPACAQTCPAQAIVFGDLNDPDSRVSRISAADRGYHALGALNTRPAVTYLKKVIP